MRSKVSVNCFIIQKLELCPMVNRIRKWYHKLLLAVDPTLVDPESDSIYLCGNSLGLMPKATQTIMMQQLDKWAKMWVIRPDLSKQLTGFRGVFGHMNGDIPWAHSDEHALEGIGRLVGAKKEEVSVCNGLTVNIHVLLVFHSQIVSTKYSIAECILQTDGDTSQNSSRV